MREGELSRSQESLEKTKTFSDFGLSNMEAMRLLRNFGLLGKKGVTGKLEGKERTYRNVAEHCLVVGITTDVILQKLEERGFLTPEERKKGTKAAMIHDLTKRQEIETQYGIESGDPQKFLNPDEKKEFIADQLKERGVSKDDVETFSLSDLAGDGSLYLPEDGEINITISPEDLIKFAIFFCDYAVASTNLVVFNERFSEAIKNGGYNDLFMWWYKKLYGQEKLKDIKSSNEVAEKVYGKVEAFLKKTEEQFKNLMGIDKSESLLNYIKKEIKKRYKSNAI